MTAALDRLALSRSAQAATLTSLATPETTLPSLARIAALLASPLEAPPQAAPQAPVAIAPMRDRPSLEAIADPAQFVVAAYEAALGHKPTRETLRAEVAGLESGAPRQLVCERLASSSEFVRRAVGADHAVQAGVPVELSAGGKTTTVLWPYPSGSRHGGPEVLSGAADPANLREAMEPFARYFGAGTRGSMMQALGEASAKGEVYPGSAASQELAGIAQNLFWDVPMQQNSDPAMRQLGVASDLGRPEAMVSYLQGQKTRIEGLMAQQSPSYDGAYHVAAAQELAAMVDGALARAQGFMAGDRSAMVATVRGDYGLYDAAQPLASQVPSHVGPEISENPRQAESQAAAQQVAQANRLPDTSFFRRLSTHLLGY